MKTLHTRMHRQHPMPFRRLNALSDGSKYPLSTVPMWFIETGSTSSCIEHNGVLLRQYIVKDYRIDLLKANSLCTASTDKKKKYAFLLAQI